MKSTRVREWQFRVALHTGPRESLRIGADGPGFRGAGWAGSGFQFVGPRHVVTE